MNVDELLREAAPDQNHLRAHTDALRTDVLIRATVTRRRSRRPLRVAVAGAAVAAIGLGGVAYAAGTVPAWMQHAKDRFGADQGIAPSDRPDLTQVVDLELPDGSHFAAWRGSTDAMWCTAYTDRWDGVGSGDSGATTCGDESSGYDLNGVRLWWAHGESDATYYPVLWGDVDEDVAAVRITGRFTGTGKQVDTTVPVDPGTRSFAATLPGTTDQPWERELRQSGITLEFLDADGAVLRSAAAPSY